MILRFELTSRNLIGLQRDGKVRQVTWESGPPPRIDGYTVGINSSDPASPPRHAGERHPDADEVILVLSGRLEVYLEDENGSETLCEASAGEALVIPQGIWHRLNALEPSRFINITPGPHGEARPLARN
jgi:hypothetical protein